MLRRPRRSTLFPDTTRFRSVAAGIAGDVVEALAAVQPQIVARPTEQPVVPRPAVERVVVPVTEQHVAPVAADRKSTRLNSSHANISYAVFCLKKKSTLYSTP